VVADLVSLDDVRAAAERLRSVAVRTPLLAFPGSAAAVGPPALLLKPESLQPTGAFKLRGAYNAIATLLAEGQLAGVVTHSSGNHGFAVAYAGALLGVPAAIVVPDNAAKVKTDLIGSVGAEIIRVAPTLAARIEASQRIARERGYAEVPPFDDRRVIAGQGTIGLEIAEDLVGPGAPAAVLVPVAGGGLISGIAVAVKALRPGTRVIGVEPELAADARDSLRAGQRIAWAAADTARTRADALRAEQVGAVTFPHIQALVDDIVTVSEQEILAAVRRLALEGRLVAEPGGAVATAAALFRSPAELGLAGGSLIPGGLLTPGPGGLVTPGTAAPVVAVVSGGNIDPTLLADVLRDQSYTG
jgi:threo-3-hydroxy-L-aspartate ammonia-lyase